MGCGVGYAGGMAKTTTVRRSKPASDTPEPTLPTHAQGLALFDAVIVELEHGGWVRGRVDTLNHPTHNPEPLADRFTIRHHYDHGVWELYFEPDRYWTKVPHPDSRTARIRIDRPGPLPTAHAVIADLLGPRTGRYFPAKKETGQ